MSPSLPRKTHNDHLAPIENSHERHRRELLRTSNVPSSAVSTTNPSLEFRDLVWRTLYESYFLARVAALRASKLRTATLWTTMVSGGTAGGGGLVSLWDGSTYGAWVSLFGGFCVVVSTTLNRPETLKSAQEASRRMDAVSGALQALYDDHNIGKGSSSVRRKLFDELRQEFQAARLDIPSTILLSHRTITRVQMDVTAHVQQRGYVRRNNV